MSPVLGGRGGGVILLLPNAPGCGRGGSHPRFGFEPAYSPSQAGKASLPAMFRYRPNCARDAVSAAITPTRDLAADGRPCWNVAGHAIPMLAGGGVADCQAYKQVASDQRPACACGGVVKRPLALPRGRTRIMVPPRCVMTRCDRSSFGARRVLNGAYKTLKNIRSNMCGCKFLC